MAFVSYIDMMLGGGTSHNTSKGLQHSYKCPFCDDHKQRLFINWSRQVYFCHHCEATGTLVSLISDHSKVTYKDALSIFREHFGYDFHVSEDLESEIYSKLYKSEESCIKSYYKHPLPEEFVLIEEAKGKVGKDALEYVKSRGISLDTCEKHYIGYCGEGDYANRIIMPDFEDGELVYWQARTWEPQPKHKLLQKHYRKVLNPSLTEEQVNQGIISIDKSMVISNIDSLREKGTAVICEGKIDAYTIGDIGACIHGKHLSDFQLIKLVENKKFISTVVVMLDGDAFSYSLRTAQRLSMYFDDVLVCRLPEDKDPNTLGTRGCLEAINDALPYTSTFNIKARLKGWV